MILHMFAEYTVFEFLLKNKYGQAKTLYYLKQQSKKKNKKKQQQSLIMLYKKGKWQITRKPFNIIYLLQLSLKQGKTITWIRKLIPNTANSGEFT